MNINISKTKAIKFKTHSSKKFDLNLTYIGNKIDLIYSRVFLGITLDENFNWKKHINLVCSKANDFVLALHRLVYCFAGDSSQCVSWVRGFSSAL